MHSKYHTCVLLKHGHLHAELQGHIIIFNISARNTYAGTFNWNYQHGTIILELSFWNYHVTSHIQQQEHCYITTRQFTTQMTIYLIILRSFYVFKILCATSFVYIHHMYLLSDIFYLWNVWTHILPLHTNIQLLDEGVKSGSGELCYVVICAPIHQLNVLLPNTAFN